MIGSTGYDENYFKGREIEDKDHWIILDWLSYTNPKTVLDVGCGTGKFVEICRQNKIKAYGFDPNLPENAYPNTSKEFKKEWPDKFDLVISNDVMEHLKDEKEVEEMLEFIKSKARDYVIFSICDLEHWDIYVDETHNFCRSYDWWQSKLGEFFEMIETPKTWMFYKQIHIAKIRTD